MSINVVSVNLFFLVDDVLARWIDNRQEMPKMCWRGNRNDVKYYSEKQYREKESTKTAIKSRGPKKCLKQCEKFL